MWFGLYLIFMLFRVIGSACFGLQIIVRIRAGNSQPVYNTGPSSRDLVPFDFFGSLVSQQFLLFQLLYKKDKYDVKVRRFYNAFRSCIERITSANHLACYSIFS